jgi:8-oxo-dGTP pyrophosphatase MutT (NUDIX family)
MAANREQKLQMHEVAPVRKSMRAILLNSENELLLLKADDPRTTTTSGRYNGPYWFLVGGAIEPGEEIEDAVLREIHEETNIAKEHISLGPIVWQGEFDLIINGIVSRQNQRFIVARTSEIRVSLQNLTLQEKKVIKDIRWFSLEKIERSRELIYPLCLKRYLPAILQGHYPAEPLEIDLGENPKL